MSIPKTGPKARKIYNLYPKLLGPMATWKPHIERIARLGFTHIYLNPLHAPGFSGSDYAVKDYYLYHPLFVDGTEDHSHLESQRSRGDALLAEVCAHAASLGMKVILDLVINHTAIDSPLVAVHPDWYEHEADGRVKNPGAQDGDRWITWGDLAQIDNAHSPDRDRLWQYWLDLVLHFGSLGVRGFRCDAAYHLPSSLWRYLISASKNKYPDMEYVAETLGCQNHELVETADAGFDAVMNSFKWWNFHDPWFLDQYRLWAGKYPSIAFPENHDTLRFADEAGGLRHLAIMRYAVSAWLFSGVAATLGFEYGFRRKIDVVNTRPDWWESGAYDIQDEIARINIIKDQYPILAMDTPIETVETGNGAIRGFTRSTPDRKEKIFVLFNTDGYQYHQYRHPNLMELMGGTGTADISHGHRMGAVPSNFEYGLAPGEVKLFIRSTP